VPSFSAFVDYNNGTPDAAPIFFPERPFADARSLHFARPCQTRFEFLRSQHE
jgi:hypothetical protein